MGKHVRRTQKNIGLRTVIPLSNNLTLLLGLTLSSPGSGLQKTSWEHFCQSLINAKIALILSVFLTGPQRFLCQKGKFHIKSKKWKSVLWNPLIRQALISSDKHRDANNKLLTLCKVVIILTYPPEMIFYQLIEIWFFLSSLWKWYF